MSQQSDKKTTKQVRIDSEWHKYLKVEAAQQGMTVRALLESILADYEYASRQKREDER